MNPKIIYSDNFLNSISWFGKIQGIALFPFIILRKQHIGTVRGEQLINHEIIHFQQQLETLVVPYYLIYGINFLINVIRGDDTPYLNLLSEREAFENEKNLDYLKTRKRYSWLKN